MGEVGLLSSFWMCPDLFCLFMMVFALLFFRSQSQALVTLRSVPFCRDLVRALTELTVKTEREED